MKNKPEAGECLGRKLTSPYSQAIATLCTPIPVPIFIEEQFESAEVLPTGLDEFAEARDSSRVSFNGRLEAYRELRKACVLELLR